MLKRVIASLGLVAMTSTLAMADPFDAKTVPADAKWVVHIDVDAITNSSFWPLIEQKLNANPSFQNGLQQVEMVAGMSLPQDLHSVTLYGMGFTDPDGVILAKARANQQQLLNLLQTNPSFTSFSHGTHEIVSWEDKGKLMHGAFFSTDRVVMGQLKENVEKALDTLDGKAASIKPDSVMAQPTGTGVLAGLASDAVTQLGQKPENKNNPVFQNLNSAWLTLSEQGENVTLKGTFGAADAAKAQQFKSMADGFKSLGIMMGGNADADPKLKAIAPLLPAAEITSQGSNVIINWTVPFQQVQQAAEQLRLIEAQSTRRRQLASALCYMSAVEVSLIADEPSALPTDDQSLARLARAGDTAAMEALVRRWQVPLVRFLQRRVGSHSDAEDLFQDTFIRVYQNLHNYDDRRSFKTWLFTIAWRLAANHLRDRRRPAGDDALEAVRDDAPRPDESAQQHDLHEGLWAIARRVLSDDHYQMLWLCYVEGFTLARDRRRDGQVLGRGKDRPAPRPPGIGAPRARDRKDGIAMNANPTPNDPVGRQLAADAQSLSPAFSERLHQRTMRAVRAQHVRATLSQRQPGWGLPTAAAAAILLAAARMVAHRPSHPRPAPARPPTPGHWHRPRRPRRRRTAPPRLPTAPARHRRNRRQQPRPTPARCPLLRPLHRQPTPHRPPPHPQNRPAP